MFSGKSAIGKHTRGWSATNLISRELRMVPECKKYKQGCGRWRRKPLS